MLADGVPAPGFLLEQVDREGPPLLLARARGRDPRVLARADAALTRPLTAARLSRGHAWLARVEALQRPGKPQKAELEFGTGEGVSTCEKPSRKNTGNGHFAIHNTQ
jgi:hypothetical protein